MQIYAIRVILPIHTHFLQFMEMKWKNLNIHCLVKARIEKLFFKKRIRVVKLSDLFQTGKRPGVLLVRMKYV